ncbi:odorant receptor Or2-like isoform X1 [Venturia canescens]|uniref:odorant receptor Or2-like isoform X1 n=1 Tax=Venturia canescens TaxID=32260 RepID=UPI001C9D0841|nr:odorant receptor Or2-like isoform X1 [Venturia canescens]
MDIPQSRFYRINETTLRLAGLWPYQVRKCQKIQRILFHIGVMTVMLTQGIKLIEVWGDLDVMIECLTPMGVQFNACVKSLNCIINRRKMKKLLEQIKTDWSSLKREEEIKILATYSEQGRKLSLLYIVYMYGTIVIYLTIPLLPAMLDIIVPLNESRPRTHLYRTEYFVDPEKYFFPIMLHTYIGTIITISIVAASDTMFMTYIQHVCGMLAVIGHRFEKLIKIRNTQNGPSKYDDPCYEELVRCIEQHFHAAEYVDLVERSYSMSFMIQTIVSMVLLSMSAVQLLIKFGETDEMLRMIQFNLAQFCHIFYNSWPGQKLLDQSVIFRDSVYSSEWYSLSARSKVLFNFIMLRTLKPLKLTAGNLYDLSLENFGVVIRASASYFTVFASLR